MLGLNAFIAPPAERLSETQLLREHAAAILWVKSQMAKHGIAIDDLIAAGCFAATTPTMGSGDVQPLRYKDAEGHTWDGRGRLPDWLQRAVNAGQSVDHFKIA